MARFANSVMFTPASAGTVDFVVSAAVQGYMTPALAGAPTGVYKYRAESTDLSQWEIGEGTYTSGTTTLTRTTVLYNNAGTGTGAGQSGAGSKINFTVAPNVGIVQATEDTLGVDQANAWSAAQRSQARQNISASIAGRIFGLILSAAGSTATFGVAVGECADSTAVDIMALTSAYTKTTSSWAVGSTNGALDTGTIANSTWYHVFLIKRTDTGVVDVLVSTSATAPTLPTSYTLFRRIGSMKTDGSAKWVAFTQLGDEFLWNTSIADVSNSTTQSTTAVLYTLSVPTSTQPIALISSTADKATTNGSFVVYISSPDTSDEVPATPGNPGPVSFSLYGGGITEGVSTGELRKRVNTSSQVRARASVALTRFNIQTYGWVDTRGRLT